MPNKRSVFGWAAKGRREQHLLRQRFARGLRETSEQGSIEGARGDRHDANPHTGELTGERQRHGNDAALGGGICRLADLAVERRNRGGDDDYATLTTNRRRIRRHGRRGKADYIERADQIDVDDAREVFERLHAFLAENAFGGPNTGSAHDTVKGAESLDRTVDAPLYVIASRHVRTHKLRSAPQPLRMGTSRRFTDVGDDDATASGNDHVCRRCAEARRAATHKDAPPAHLHPAALSRPSRPPSPRRAPTPRPSQGRSPRPIASCDSIAPRTPKRPAIFRPPA